MKRLTAERLADGLIELTATESYRARALQVAAAIAKEDGIGRAIEIIESTNQ